MLKLDNIKKAYEGTDILKGITIDVEDGEIVSILGPSGSGKTTLLNIILGIVQLIDKNIELDNITKENLIRHVDIMKQNSYRLLRLVNNLIDISRIDIGYYNLQPSNYNIVKVIEDITLSIAEYVKHKNGNFSSTL